MRATAKELRFNTKELLDTVSRGEEVIITYHGKPCAKLVPIGNEQNNKSAGDELFGIWKDNDGVKNVEDYVQNSRHGRVKNAG